MSPWRIGRTKRGDLRLEILGPRDCWYGAVLTEDDARQLSKALCHAVTPTAGELSLDNTTEP